MLTSLNTGLSWPYDQRKGPWRPTPTGERACSRWFAAGARVRRAGCVTGRDRYLTESVKGTDAAAMKRAEKVMTRLQADVDRQRAPQTAIPLGRVLDEWLQTAEFEDTTRRTYAGYFE